MLAISSIGQEHSRFDYRCTMPADSPVANSKSKPHLPVTEEGPNHTTDHPSKGPSLGTGLEPGRFSVHPLARHWRRKRARRNRDVMGIRPRLHCVHPRHGLWNAAGRKPRQRSNSPKLKCQSMRRHSSGPERPRIPPAAPPPSRHTQRAKGDRACIWRRSAARSADGWRQQHAVPRSDPERLRG